MAADMIVFRNDLVERTLALVVSQDRTRPRLYAWVRAMATASKLYEQALLSVFFGMTFGQAVGAQRDAWGKVIGELRGALDETTYQLYQELRLYVLNTDATVPKAIALLQLALPGRDVTAGQLLPNGAHFVVTGGGYMPEAARSHLAGLIRDYQPLGHTYLVGEVPGGAIEFERTMLDNEGRVWPEIIFGGR